MTNGESAETKALGRCLTPLTASSYRMLLPSAVLSSALDTHGDEMVGATKMKIKDHLSVNGWVPSYCLHSVWKMIGERHPDSAVALEVASTVPLTAIGTDRRVLLPPSSVARV